MVIADADLVGHTPEAFIQQRIRGVDRRQRPTLLPSRTPKSRRQQWLASA
jgi:hypothetical protein